MYICKCLTAGGRKWLSDLLMSVAFPDIDASQVGHNERPQLLVCCHLTEGKKKKERH